MSEFENIKEELKSIVKETDSYEFSDFSDSWGDEDNLGKILFDITSKEEMDGVKVISNSEEEGFVIIKQEGERMGEGVIWKSDDSYAVEEKSELYRRVRKEIQGASRFKV
jgi:hypothetical protein